MRLSPGWHDSCEYAPLTILAILHSPHLFPRGTLHATWQTRAIPNQHQHQHRHHYPHQRCTIRLHLALKLPFSSYSFGTLIIVIGILRHGYNGLRQRNSSISLGQIWQQEWIYLYYRLNQLLSPDVLNLQTFTVGVKFFPLFGIDAILRRIKTCPAWHTAIVHTFVYSLDTFTSILRASEGVN